MNGISVIICSYNSEDLIEENLAHFAAQEKVNFPWEIILVNNNSTDKTVEKAEVFWNKANSEIPLIVVNESRPGIAFARQKGIEVSRYEVISFVDDDNFVPENWIKYIGGKFQDSQVGILGTTAIENFSFTPDPWFNTHKNSFAIGSLYEDQYSDVTKKGTVYGAGMSIRKEIYNKLKSLNWEPLLSGRIGDSQLSGDDTELCLAANLAGYRIYYSNEIKFKHTLSKDRVSEERLIKLASAFGKADVYLLPYQLKLSPKSLRNSLRKNWRFNLIGKKISLLKLKIKNYKGILNDFDYSIYATRNIAFQNEIKKNYRNFKRAFEKVEKTFS